MAQDDHKQRSVNSSCASGAGRSSKKLKQKKIPQRGLGVAQLEKIRLGEQQKKDVPSQNKNPILAPSFRQNPPPQIDLDLVFNAIPGSDFSEKNRVPYSKPLSLGQGNWGKMLNSEHILEGDGHRFHQSGGFAFRPNANLIHESLPPAPSGIATKELFQPQNSSSSMVKVSSGTSSSSVITNNQMEPPSNQSFYGKIYTSSKWPEDHEKMIGIKRPYPFSLNPSYPCKFPPVHVQYPVGRSVESPSSVNGGLIHVEPRNPLLREGPTSLSTMPETRTEKLTEKNCNLDGDFLSLALPKSSFPHPTRELSEAGLKLQENVDVPNFYSFFPTSKALNGQSTDANTSCSGKVAEKLDLDLKL